MSDHHVGRTGSVLAAIGAVLAIALLVASGAAGAGLTSDVRGSVAVTPSGVVGGSEPGPPASASLAASQRAWSTALNSADRALGDLTPSDWSTVHALSAMNDSDLKEWLSHVPGFAHESPSQVRRALAIAEGQFVLMGINTGCSSSLLTAGGCVLATCAVGAVTGAIIGTAVPGIGTGVGAGAGCAVGAVIEVLALIFGAGTANSVDYTLEFNLELALAAQLNTVLQACQGLVLQSQSVLNSTQYAWNAMADAAALAQLPNGTFDALADMEASGVAWQFATTLTNYANCLQAYGGINQAMAGIYGTGGGYSSTCDYDLSGSSSGGPFFGCGAGMTPATDAFYQSAGAGVEGSLTNGSGVVVNPGGFFYASCSTATHLNVPNGTTQINLVGGNTFRLVNAFPPVAHVYRANTGGGTCDLIGLGFAMVPSQSVGSPTSTIVLVSCGQDKLPNGTGCQPWNQSAGNTGFKPTFPFTFQVNQIGGGRVSPVYHATGVFANYATEINAVMNAAETNAKTYWTFLHLLGYTNANQIPSNCKIPFPNQILSPQTAQGIGNLSLNQSLSLYQAWLNALAVFFNVQGNATNFCNGHSVFSVGLTAWNLNTQLTGFVYTLPVAHQTFGTMSTWTVTNATGTNLNVGNASNNKGLRTQPAPIVVWPEATTLFVRVGQVQEIPVNDPIDVFSPLNGTLYTLYGNGTAVGSTGWSNGTASSAAGSAIFISTCGVKQANGAYAPAPNNACPLVLSSIQNVSFSYPCATATVNGVCSSAGSIQSLNGACGQTAPVWSQFVTAFASFTGTSPIGCLVAEIGAAVVLFALVVLGFLAIVYVLRRD